MLWDSQISYKILLSAEGLAKTSFTLILNVATVVDASSICIHKDLFILIF